MLQWIRRRRQPVRQAPCYKIRHLELDGVVLCPEGKRLHAPGFWSRFRSKCRNIRHHEHGYVLAMECMWCRWVYDNNIRSGVAKGIFPEPPLTPRWEERPDLNLYSPTLADLQRDDAHRQFLADLRDQAQAEATTGAT